MAKIALAGGGTGGHVYPALAMGDVLRDAGHEVVYYGDASRLEARVAPQRGYSFRPLAAVPYPRAGLVGKVKFAYDLGRAVLAARRQLRQDQIDLVLGVGGYISAPPVLAAWTLGRGRVVHEANVAPGLANQLCARVAQAVLLTYAETAARLPGKAPRHVVGVPVNPRILEGDRDEAAKRYGLDPTRPTVLFVGGSLGATTINNLGIAAAHQTARTYQVLHLCGPRFFPEVQAALGEAPPGCRLVAYEDRMGFAYQLADLVVCRSGATTLAEVCAVGRPSLLIPSPNVTENHQEHNARGLEAAGAAEVVVESELDVDAVLRRIAAWVADSDRLHRMARAARAQAKLDAAEQAAAVVKSLLP
jgi:UDP-N-acetylglucosamine--N-acetylmuramyl-(pentapeptide) pyrophosphoryl-undecaprenol N-acetylglucosamine transferase